MQKLVCEDTLARQLSFWLDKVISLRKAMYLKLEENYVSLSTNFMPRYVLFACVLISEKVSVFNTREIKFFNLRES